MNIQEELLKKQDLQYKSFSEKLIPNIDPSTIIGIRTPELRSFTKNISDDDRKIFLQNLPHQYHEENLVHIYLLNEIKDPNIFFKELDKILPYITNWAVSDSIKPKCFLKRERILEINVLQLIQSKEIYTNRVGLLFLMSYYVKDYFTEEQLKIALNSELDDYYSHMILAWYLATLAIYQFDLVYQVLVSGNISKDTKRKTIQKMKDSYRITEKQKEIIRKIKIA